MRIRFITVREGPEDVCETEEAIFHLRRPFLVFVPGYVMDRPLRRYVPGYKCYSKEDVDRALELVHEGATSIEAAKATRVPDSSIRRLLRKCTAHTGLCKGARHRPGTVWHSLEMSHLGGGSSTA